MLVSIWVLICCVLLVCLVARLLARGSFGGGVVLVDAIPSAAVLVLCATCLFAGIFECLGWRSPGNAGLAAVYSLALLLYFAYIAYRRRKLAMNGECPRVRDDRPPLKGALVQTAPYLVILIVVVGCALVQFGPSIQINFASTDPGTHFNLTMQTLETGRFPTTRWFTYYISARGIELLSPILPEGMEYKAFIVMEVAYLYLNGCMFYSLSRRLHLGGGRPTAILVLSLVYLLGYPLNVLAFGFSYLGVGVTLLLTYVSVLADCERPSLRQISLAALPLVSLVFCYSLFVPVALLGTLLAATIRKREVIVRHKRVAVCIATLVVVLTVALVGMVVRSGVVSVLSSPGYSYTNLYGDFVLVVPVAMFGLVLLCRKPSGVGESVVGMTLAVVCATVFALVLYREGILSAYYYFKFYYILWPCTFLCAVSGMEELWQSQPRFFIGYGALWMLVLVAAISGVDKRLTNTRPDLSPNPTSSALAGVYSNNVNEMKSPRISDAEVELWLAAGDMRRTPEDYIPLLGTNIDVYWYQAITRQYYKSDARLYYYWLYTDTDWGAKYIENLSEVEHCVILYTQELPSNLSEYLENKRIVFENSAGYIVNLT